MRVFKILFGVILLFTFAACQQMETTQYGVLFRRLPPAVGGGVSKSIVRPGETVLLMPWDSIYRFDTKPKDVSWGSLERGRSADPGQSDFVYSRASDGNEVALAFTIRYQVSTDPDKLVGLVERTATTDEEVRDLVVAVGRSDIRRFMNELHTGEFLDTSHRYEAVDKVRRSMQELLGPAGIEIRQVNLDNYLFERKLKDGSIDASYQTRLTDIQRLTEDTERERSRMDTVEAQKRQEENAARAHKSQIEAEALGYKEQAKLRGKGYIKARENEAAGILARGKAEVEGITAQINALNGPGGEALLKLEVAKQLRQSNPKFIVLGHGKGGSGVDVNKVDTNQLIQQIGLLEALKDPPVKNEESRASMKQTEQSKK